jgi:hypothetical protein
MLDNRSCRGGEDGRLASIPSSHKAHQNRPRPRARKVGPE